MISSKHAYNKPILFLFMISSEHACTKPILFLFMNSIKHAFTEFIIYDRLWTWIYSKFPIHHLWSHLYEFTKLLLLFLYLWSHLNKHLLNLSYLLFMIFFEHLFIELIFWFSLYVNRKTKVNSRLEV